MLGKMLLVLMSGSALPNQSDVMLQEQLLHLSEELSVCPRDEKYQSLFSLSALPYNQADSEWALSQLIDSSFLSCPRAFMHALKSAPYDARKSVLKLFGKYGQPTVLAESLWQLQGDGELGAFVKGNFSGFGVMERH